MKTEQQSLKIIRQVDRAAGRYERSLRNAGSPRRGDGNTRAQAQRYREGCERAELISLRTREVIYPLGVAMVDVISYRSFALSIDKVCRKYSAETRRMLIYETITRWTLRGLDSEVLRAICRGVFSMSEDDLRPSV